MLEIFYAAPSIHTYLAGVAPREDTVKVHYGKDVG